MKSSDKSDSTRRGDQKLRCSRCGEPVTLVQSDGGIKIRNRSVIIYPNKMRVVCRSCKEPVDVPIKILVAAKAKIKYA